MPLNTPKFLWDYLPDAHRDIGLAKRIPADGLEELRVDVQTLGNLLLHFDARQQADVLAAGDAHLLPGRVERVGNILHVEGRNLGAYFNQGQTRKVLLELHLPAAIKVSVKFVAGSVTLHGGAGDVRIRGNVGEVRGITQSKSVRVRLRCGEVALNELPGRAGIDVALGNVALRWSRLRGTERVHARAGLGAVDLFLPQGVAQQDECHVLFSEKRVNTPEGTSIFARVGFGGLEVAQSTQAHSRR